MSRLQGPYNPPGQSPGSSSRGEGARQPKASAAPLPPTSPPPSVPTVYLQDPDVTLWHGDVLETLRQLPDGSVDCVVTSPPYWGLRDYGTGLWEGGDPDCAHEGSERYYTEKTAAVSSAGAFSEPGEANKERLKKGRWREKGECVKCGARRRDQQLGLEATPDEYVERLVGVFREVWRVLADYGTCWVNLGDSYAGSWGAQSREDSEEVKADTLRKAVAVETGRPASSEGISGAQIRAHPKRTNTGTIRQPGLKPKDLCGIPWMVAFALRADGWYLRSDIVWSKPNPMPESVTDRPTKAHEYVFLLSKRPRYFFDQEAVREKATAHSWQTDEPGTKDATRNGQYGTKPQEFRAYQPSSRNVRSVWEIATQPYPEAHFATFPEELARRCILAGCPEWVCSVCGKPRERIVEARSIERDELPRGDSRYRPGRYETGVSTNVHGGSNRGMRLHESQTVGWSDCGCGQGFRPGVVLDPFVGSGTVCHVARLHGRHSIGIDLNGDYLKLAARRLQQLSLLAEAT